MTPSAYLRQHFEVEAPRIDEAAYRPWWRLRVRTRLDRLFASGAITSADWQAGLRFRAAVDHLNRSGHAFERYSGGERVGLGRFDATEHIERVKAALGPIATALVWSCVVDDASWVAVGAWLCIDPKTARRWTVIALQALSSMNRGGPQCADA